MESIPKRKLWKIIKGHLIDGLSRDENAALAGVAAGTVSSYTDRIGEGIGEENARWIREQAEKRAKDELYDRVYRSEIPVPLWDSLDHKANMIAITQGRDKKIAARESLAHFIEHYDPLVGLLQATTQEAIKLKQLQTLANWAQYQYDQFQAQIPALKMVHDGLRNRIDRLSTRMDNIEKKHKENVDLLVNEERKRQKNIQELDKEINKRSEAIAKLDEELSKKKDGVLAVTNAPKFTSVDPIAKEQGVVHFGSVQTAILHSGYVMSSGFAANAPPPELPPP